MAQADPNELNRYLDFYTQALGAPEGLLMAIAMRESNYDPDTGTFLNVRNSVGATGLMQLRPIAIQDIKRAFGVTIDPFDPIWSIYGAALLFVLNYRYITASLKSPPSWDALVVAYNGGWTAGKYYMRNGVAPSVEGRNYLAFVSQATDFSEA